MPQQSEKGYKLVKPIKAKRRKRQIAEAFIFFLLTLIPLLLHLMYR